MDEKSAYFSWCGWVIDAISYKALQNVFFTSRVKSSVASSSNKPAAELSVLFTWEQFERASNIIVSALGDCGLSVIRSVIGQPHNILQKQDALINSKPIAARIFKMAKLVSEKYSNAREDISKHVDCLSRPLEQLGVIVTPLPDYLAVEILILSVEVS